MEQKMIEDIQARLDEFEKSEAVINECFECVAGENYSKDVHILLVEISCQAAEIERLKETQTFIKEKLHSMPIGNKALESIRRQLLERLEDTTCGQ